MQAAIARTAALAGGPIARGAVISAAVRLGGLGLSFAQGVLTARLLGAAGYGAVAFVMALAQVCATAAMLGLGPLAVREVPVRLANGEADMLRQFARKASLAVAAASGALALLIAMTGARLFPEAHAPLAVFCAALVPPLALIALWRGMAQGFGKVVLAQAPFDVFRPAAMVAGLGLCLGAGFLLAPSGFLILTIAVSLALAACSGIGAWRCLPERPATPASAPLRPWLGQGLPFLGLALASLLMGEVNTLLLGWFADSTQTGLFQPVARIAPLLTLACDAAAMRFAPQVAAFWQRGEKARVARVTRQFVLATTVLTALAGLALVIAGPWLMLLYGPEFAAAAPLIGIVALAQLANAACGPAAILLNMTGSPMRTLAAVCGGLAVNALLGALLAPRLGAQGAALAMAAGIVTWNLAMQAMARRQLGIGTTILDALRLRQEAHS